MQCSQNLWTSHGMLQSMGLQRVRHDWATELTGGSGVKNAPASAGGMCSIPGSGRSSGEGNGNPLQYSCLESPMDRGAWRATVHGVTKESDMTERLTLWQNLESLVISHWAVIHLPECCTYLDTWILKLIKILSCGFDATEEIAVKV